MTPEVEERAELSNYETVRHWFGLAAERLGLRDDVAEVMRTPYREVTVQIPIKPADGRSAPTTATASSTTPPAGPARAACASTPRWTWTRCARWPS